MSNELQLDVRYLNWWWRHLVNAYESKHKVMAAYHWRDDLKSHLQADCLYPRISSGPNAR